MIMYFKVTVRVIMEEIKVLITLTGCIEEVLWSRVIVLLLYYRLYTIMCENVGCFTNLDKALIRKVRWPCWCF